jgi:hypothetical protein
LLSFKAFSQENMISLGGGYTFANIEDAENKGTGYRINGLYEFNPAGGIVSHGISFAYIHISATDDSGLQSVESTINSFPVYYAPKVMQGNDRIKLFLKAALGMQFASLKREGAVSLSDTDFGFYGGGGAGIMIYLKENLFINAEYEIAWASNSSYKDGLMNTFGSGIGFIF